MARFCGAAAPDAARRSRRCIPRSRPRPALLWGGSIALLGPGQAAIELAVAATLLLGIAVSDARAYIIPHEFSLGGTAIALAFAAWPEPVGLVDAVQGALFGAGLVLLVGELTELVLGQEAMGGGDCALMGMVGAFFGWESVWPVMALGAVHRHRAPFRGEVCATPRRRRQKDEAAPQPPLRWGKLAQLLGGGSLLAGGLGRRCTRRHGRRITARHLLRHPRRRRGVLRVVRPAEKRVARMRLVQVWGLIGAGAGIGDRRRPLDRGRRAAWRSAAARSPWRHGGRSSASPDTTEELSAQGYLPFGVGLSIAAVVLAYTGGIDRVREIFAEIGPGLGL